MTKIYSDISIIIRVKDGDSEYKKTISVGTEQSETGVDNPDFLARVLSKSLYLMQQEGAQVTLKDYEKDNQPTKLDLSDGEEPVQECTCKRYAMRNGQDVCSSADVITPMDCPLVIRKERNCPFYTVPDDEPQAPSSGKDEKKKRGRKKVD